VPRKYHPSYFFWANVPKDGYDLLPDYFWCKGENTVNQYFNSNNKHSINHHYPILGGELLYNYYKKQNISEIDSENYIDFKLLINKYDKVILLALTSIDLPFGNKALFNLPKHVVSAMKNSPDNWLWLVRLHPSCVSTHLEPLINYFKELNINNIEIRKTSIIHLLDLLENVDFLLASSTSTIFDAMKFNLPIVITKYVGFKQYEHIINQGYISYAANEESLESILNSNKIVDTAAFSENYISTNSINMNNVLNKILY